MAKLDLLYVYSLILFFGLISLMNGEKHVHVIKTYLIWQEGEGFEKKTDVLVAFAQFLHF